MEDLSRYNPEGSVLRKAQRRMLEIAVEVARICDEHGIPYWINGGTLLGAVRHGDSFRGMMILTLRYWRRIMLLC